MFGLEKQSKGKPEDFEFDLEKDVSNPKKYNELKTQTRNRMQTIKTMLRAGDNKDEFHKLGTILHGYVSLLKVMDRVVQKRK